ncbi:MAG: HAMP domain-containing histidine kinase [Lachnospiraceae bacterium]|nr:HAMP domain-containing histidine kinase [Lachnospiraceae bacterium]
MKLSKKLIIICLTLIVIPAMLLTGAWLVTSRLEARKIRQEFDLTGKIDPYSFSAAQRFDVMLTAMVSSISRESATDPDCVLKTDYLETLNARMVRMGGFILAWQNGAYYYTGGFASEEMQAYLTRVLPADDSRNVYYSENDTQYLIGSHSFQDAAGEEGTLYLISDVTDSLPALSKTVGIFLIIGIIVLLFSVMITGSWLRNSLVKPLEELQEATNAIREGNLDVPVRVVGDEEVADLCRDFEEMRKHLKEAADEQLQTEKNNKVLISNISHDLKTPITAIKGYVEGIRDGVASSPEKLDKYLHTIYNKANDMDRLVDELTLYSKIDTNRVPYNFTKIKVKEYFEDCADELREELEAQNVELELSGRVDEKTLMVGDPEQLKRVVNNIISNSVKYMDKAKKLINIRVQDGEDFVRIEIEDNGKGIANKDIPYIFDRFYRTDSSRNSSTGGSGIGLSIVKKIVEDHGGRIWASSREGFGTTMTIEMRKYKEIQHEQNTDRGRREGYRRT